MSTGWRHGFVDVIDAIQSWLADGSHPGSMSSADFLKLAGLPTSAVPTSRNIGTTAPLTGGGDLSADRTLAISAASGAAAGSMSAADFSKLAGLPSSAPPSTRNIGTTAPLTGGGDLSADRTLAISPADAVNPGSLAAADYSKLATIPAGAPILTAFSSAAFDLLSTQAATDVPIPNIAGKLFYITATRLQVTSSTGTASGTWTVQTIRNGINWGNALSVTATTFNSNAAPDQISLNTSAAIVDPSVAHPFQFQVTSAIGGFSAASGKFVILGYYA